jgi:hypothetical protein
VLACPPLRSGAPELISLAMKKSIKAIFVVGLLQLAFPVTSSGQNSPKFVIVSQLTPNLKVASVEILSDKKTAISAKMVGQMDVRAEVQYGWFIDGNSFEGKPMMELSLSKVEKKKLPHLSDWSAGYYTAISVKNVQELAPLLFTENERLSIEEKKVLLLKRTVHLTLSDIEFGSACGMYYSVTAKLKSKQFETQTVALKNGMDIHC